MMNKHTEKELSALRQTYFDLGIHNVLDFFKFSTVSIVYHSTKIEGCQLDELDTRILIEDGLTAKGKPLADHLMVQDNYNALKHVMHWASYKGVLDVEFIKKVGSLVKHHTGGITKTAMGAFDTSKGDLRLSPVYTDSRYFPDWTKIPILLNTLCHGVNSQLGNVQGLETLKLAAHLHYAITDIHPFGDGNGRVARLLMNYIQMYHGEPLVKIFSEDRKEYLEALQEADKVGDAEPLYQFIVGQQVKFLRAEIVKFEAMG